MKELNFESRLLGLTSPEHGRLSRLASGMDDVLNLGSGDPDFKTPKHVIDAAVKALDEGKTHYPSTSGLPGLRSALAEYHSRYGIDWKPSEVVVTAGSGLSLYLTLAGFLDPGDEVVLLEPYFMAYRQQLNYLRAKINPVHMREDKGYHLDVDALNEAVTPMTKLIIVCTPNNPSGTVFTGKELEQVSEIAKDNNTLVLSDEVYNEFIYDGRKHRSIASIPGMKERTVVCLSFSKSWAMTGWRLGGLLTDEPKARRISMIPVDFRPPTFVQLAGVAALKGPWGPTEEMVREYERRINFMVPRLSGIDGVSCHKPEGAFYAFPNVEELCDDSMEFCEGLLKDQRLLVLPGTAFGESSEYHVRIPLVAPIETLERAASAIESYAENYLSKH
jgi:aspartate/methionine/tyrosine aminotransferase